MTVLLLEDEPLAARRTRTYLQRYGHDLTEAGWCQSVVDAREWLGSHEHPDLIISDIELLDGNVFGLFDKVDVRAPVVFATAYDQFLLKAFETNGVGYLLKPYTYEQFEGAVDKVRGLVLQTNGLRDAPAPALDAATLTALQSALARQHVRYRERLTVRRASGITILPLTDVPLVFSEDKVVFALDATGKRHALAQTLTQLEAELDPEAWFRANRGELVHLPYVERLEPYGRDRLAVHLRGVKEIAVASRERTPALRKWVGG